MRASKRTTISTVFSLQHIGRVDSKGLGASVSPTLHPIYALGAAIRTLHYSQRGNKEHCIGQIRRALVHQAAPGGRDLQRGTSCVKANLLCSCSRIQGHKNHPKTSAFLLTPRGIKSVRGIFLPQNNNTIFFLSRICVPQTQPSSALP